MSLKQPDASPPSNPSPGPAAVPIDGSGLPSTVALGRDLCGELAQAERREWWLANGRGSYAAGTVAGSLTRRYHGLLVATLTPPLGRLLVFAKADATLIDGEREWPLFANRWTGGAVSPAGHVHLESFRLVGRLPLWRWAVGDLVLEQCIWMDHGIDRVHVAWRAVVDPGRPLGLRVALLVNARDHHGVTSMGQIAPEVALVDGRLGVAHEDRFDLRLCARGGSLSPDRTWIEGFDLPVERERGLEDRDNHLRVGYATLDLKPGVWCGIDAEIGTSGGEPPPTDPDASLKAHLDRDRRLLRQAQVAEPRLADAPDWVRQLVLAADSFLFARPLPEVPDGESVIAGYPWFGDWGRDTMIALPGLTLATGRPDSARRILMTFARFVDRGMLPNVFPGSGETAAYNTVDAALWYLDAWRAYVEASGDLAALAEVFPVLEGIVAAYRYGTRYGIGMDPADGLIRAGEPGVQLTWMDAKVGDWVVTPRIGKPVEINALWFNALVLMGGFAERLERDPGPYAELAQGVQQGFRRYLRPDGDGLIDVLDGPGGDDAALRPNQIFAVSLPASALAPGEQARVVAACGRLLLTSFGLRSLAPSHPDYRGRYLGDVWARDGAYHQGPVWGWLLGHYALAEYRVTGDAALALSRLTPLQHHLGDAGLGSVSEIFDGDPPHTPRGAPLQAWSVACALEAWWRIAHPCAAGPTAPPRTQRPRRNDAKTANQKG